ncbi:CPA1 family monovalent cation:H+ antiporter [Streptosporangium becharense]|uniref:CPA1 family monovalent cation:H+ antiporter n=1 Tax=Streptosporangium becharense TaxID=1816182 RepID=A0A7W9MJF5_9ACTN|nr:Na+/H+ antiporter [Streptosporangium becharense]MBB2911659.1 CPA1 family monovalent cation:H+ antiporter [Streptosporangium becharense]MBB5822523.1 CPA1 family monovalent cation:H+ antiporter [Streptosporangium becharense]
MDQSTVLQMLLVPVMAIAVAAVARQRGWPVPLLLVLAGLVLSPVVPDYQLDAELVLLVFLPPLLYAAAIESSYLRLKDVSRPVALLSVGLVLFTTLVIGGVAHLLMPDLPLAAAFALGAIVAPPDAVAAVAVARRLGLPRKVVAILVGESLFNDATALTVYRVAVAAALGEGVSWSAAGVEFLRSAAGGVVVGVALTWILTRVLRMLRDALVENTVMLLIPFAVYLAAESVHVSGVVAVVIVGLSIGHLMPRAAFGTRLLSDAVWRVFGFFLESIVFVLIGLQMWPIMRNLGGADPWRLGGMALAVFAAAVASRIVWVVPSIYLPRILSGRVRRREPHPPSWQNVAIVSWAGMRGVVSLAAAFAIPEGFPGRDTLLFLTFAVVIGTLLVQGLTFPALIRRLRVSNEQEIYGDNLAEAAAQQAAASAALARLEELVAAGVGETHQEVVDQLRAKSERRTLGAWERLGGGTGQEGEETPSTVYRRLRREMLAAEREVFVRLRDERRIDDEVLRRVVQDLDFEEAILERD